jgi:hypothetical protein
MKIKEPEAFTQMNIGLLHPVLFFARILLLKKDQLLQTSVMYINEQIYFSGRYVYEDDTHTNKALQHDDHSTGLR